MPHDPMAAGEFGAWLARMLAVLRGEAESDVPCGECVGCCVSSYHLVIRPADRQGIASLGEQWLRHAPGLAPGDTLLGYRDNGHCPALRENRCTIYAQRPLTCRDYDCRVFAAAGIDAGGADKQVINERVRAWTFDYAEPSDINVHDAIRAAARFIREHGDAFPAGRAPTSPTGIAVLALKAHQVFMDSAVLQRPAKEIARDMVAMI